MPLTACRQQLSPDQRKVFAQIVRDAAHRHGGPGGEWHRGERDHHDDDHDGQGDEHHHDDMPKP